MLPSDYEQGSGRWLSVRVCVCEQFFQFIDEIFVFSPLSLPVLDQKILFVEVTVTGCLQILMRRLGSLPCVRDRVSVFIFFWIIAMKSQGRMFHGPRESVLFWPFVSLFFAPHFLQVVTMAFVRVS